MGGSLNPQTSDIETADPRHEFNFWFDPEAAHIVLRADWPRIDVTTEDVSAKAPFTQEMLDAIAKSQAPAARYIAAWSHRRTDMWDELEACAWIDPAIITKEVDVLYGRRPEPRPQLRRHAGPRHWPECGSSDGAKGPV
jgi:purine nucleosidase